MPGQLSVVLAGEPSVELVGTFAGVEALLASPRRAELQVVLVEVSHGASACAAVARVIAALPRARVLAVSATRDRALVLGALRAGAVGYLLHGDAPAAVAQALLRARRGLHALSDDVLSVLVAEVLKPEPSVLSEREEELARALAAGLTYADCAAHMGIAVGTVQAYVKRVYRKLEVNSRRDVRRWVERRHSA